MYTTCLFWYQFLTICLIAYHHILTFWYLNCRIQMWLQQILFRAFSFTNLHFHNSMTIIHSLQFVFYVPNCMWFMQMLCGLLQEIISVTGKGSWYSGQGFYVPCKIYVFAGQENSRHFCFFEQFMLHQKEAEVDANGCTHFLFTFVLIHFHFPFWGISVFILDL